MKIEINLDDQTECIEFIEKHGTLKGRALANRLNLKGKASSRAATSLSNYAWNKFTAITCRNQGRISEAITYEEICDRIYSEDIKGKIECW